MTYFENVIFRAPLPLREGGEADYPGRVVCVLCLVRVLRIKQFKEE